VVSFANHLHKFGIYPIIVTRNWNPKQTNTYDEVIVNKFRHTIYDTHEEYYMPYNRSWRDKLFQKNTFMYRKLRQTLTVLELFFSAFFMRVLPYYNLYTQARKVLEHDKEISAILISGSPFESFQFGYKLKKKFPHIHWIPSYRDEWTSFKQHPDTNKLHDLLFWFNTFFEKKFTSNATFFMSVADYWVESIGKHINKSGIVVANGIRSIDGIREQSTNTEESRKDFTIIYSGTIYPNQSFAPLASLMSRLIKRYTDQMNIVFNIYGVSSDSSMRETILKDFSYYSFQPNVFERIPVHDLHNKLIQADLLYITPYTNLSGFIPVKVFDYFEVERYMLFFPSDRGEIHKFIKSTHSGLAIESEDECFTAISGLIDLKLIGPPYPINQNKENAWFYTREHQVSKLADKIKSLPPLF